MEGSFHGRTMGALALTAKAGLPRAVRAAAGPRHLRPVRRRRRARRGGHRRDRRASSSSRSRARPAWSSRPTGYLAGPGEITAEHGALLWLDEVQTGMGRTGDWFAHATIAAIAPGRGDPRQGAGRRHPDRRDGRGRRSAARCSARQPRHHVRRQPDRGRGARWPSSRPSRRTACSTTPPRSASVLRDGLARRARHRDPRTRPADRARPRRARSRPRSSTPPRRTA